MKTPQAAPVYVSYREEKKTTPKGHRQLYSLRFYLVDACGTEVLAATGEDQGDAHYLYRNTDEITGYPELKCHNRKDLIQWLQGVIDKSQDNAAFHVESAHDEEHLAEIKAKQCPHEFPSFVGFRVEKTQQSEDGLRCRSWYLIDEHGLEHLAVRGEERDTRDGHYTYSTVEPFKSTHSMTCGSQNKVLVWIEEMIAIHRHGSGDGGGEASSAGLGQSDSEPRPRSTGKRTSGKNTGFKRGLKQTGPGKKNSSSKRVKVADIPQIPLPPAVVPPESRQLLESVCTWAVSEASKRKSLAQAAVDWLRGPYKENEWSCVEHYSTRIKEILDQPEDMDPLRLTLNAIEAIQEVGSGYINLKMLEDSDILTLMKQLVKHKDPVIASMAREMCVKWQCTIAHHISVLCNPIYTQDPVDEVVKLIVDSGPSPAAKQPPPCETRPTVPPLFPPLTTSLHNEAPPDDEAGGEVVVVGEKGGAGVGVVLDAPATIARRALDAELDMAAQEEAPDREAATGAVPQGEDGEGDGVGCGGNGDGADGDAQGDGAHSGVLHDVASDTADVEQVVDAVLDIVNEEMAQEDVGGLGLVESGVADDEEDEEMEDALLLDFKQESIDDIFVDAVPQQDFDMDALQQRSPPEL